MSNRLSQQDIEHLLPKCIAGNAKAQQRLYEAFLPYVYTICKRYSIPNSYLKDMIQDIYSNVFNSLSNYQSDTGSFKTWLRTIAVYKLIDYKRREKPADLELLEYTNQLTVSETVFDDLYLQNLLDLIEDMPNGYRIVINMFLVEGYSHKEIASHLEISVETSRSQLSRGKSWLRKRLIDLNSHNSSLDTLLKSI